MISIGTRSAPFQGMTAREHKRLRLVALLWIAIVALFPHGRGSASTTAGRVSAPSVTMALVDGFAKIQRIEGSSGATAMQAPHPADSTER
jgi:hypothetical protein